jgi:hypothetical protein
MSPLPTEIKFKFCFRRVFPNSLNLCTFYFFDDNKCVSFTFFDFHDNQNVTITQQNSDVLLYKKLFLKIQQHEFDSVLETIMSHAHQVTKQF